MSINSMKRLIKQMNNNEKTTINIWMHMKLSKQNIPKIQDKFGNGTRFPCSCSLYINTEVNSL